MLILGINSLYHESAACLLQNGEIVAFAEEERFNRVKHGKAPRIDNPDQLPWHAIDFCLHTAGIELRELDHAGYSSNPRFRELMSRDQASDGTHEFNRNIRRVPGKLRERGFAGAFHWVDHHMAHAASAYFASPFADAAVLSIDGIGDTNSTALFHGRNDRLVLRHSVDNPHSIGFLWELVSMYLGFDIYDATKIMGLAAYGDPLRYLAQFRTLVKPTRHGTFETDQEQLQFWKLDYTQPTGYFAGLESLFDLRRRRPGEPLEQAQQDVAAALQHVTDDILLGMVCQFHKETGSTNLCLAGGVALNCVSNQRVFEEGPFEQLFVQPAAHDAGTAIGAAAYIWHHQCGGQRCPAMQHAYYGPEYTQEQIEESLVKHGLAYTRPDHLERKIASLLADGNVIGYFQGRMEMGPRALGNRSLLADPRDANMRDMLNYKVKHREYFRPFAPSVLAEAAQEWFQIAKPTSAADYMLMAYPVPGPLREKIPAVIHCDGTSRIQTVRRETNPRYHAVISEFAQLTGVPLVLNTSFNDSEPIVCSPEDAIHTFLKTRIDYLAIGDFLVSKAASGTQAG